MERMSVSKYQPPYHKYALRKSHSNNDTVNTKQKTEKIVTHYSVRLNPF